MRVLVVEDEPDLARAIARGLRREGMAVDIANDGDAALDKGLVHDYDAVVLDRDLPRLHGDDVCRALIDSGRDARILMLTASGAVNDRVAGLELGADDYLAKPFEFVELVARLRALGRRSPARVPPVLRRSGIELDPARRSVTRDGGAVDLTPKEFAVLQVLLEAEGRVVSSEELL
ncbi:MAG: response regulator transcription factor, partial [Chloroflexi bacterium]|nr:response regulator transcription factor [Chloroflexota bacterium]